MLKRMQNGYVLIVVVLAAITVTGCSNNKFRGNGSGKKPQPSPTPETTTVDKCKNKTDVVGVDLAFVIDNSGSNVYTDCPGAQYAGQHKSGNASYRCASATNREGAVAEAYDALLGISKGDAASDSRLSITSFPSDDNIFNGSEVRTQNWVSVSANDKAGITSAMAFSRAPIGMTPYGAGLEAAAGLFETLEDGPKPRLLILVTDGEPTDESPGQVIDQAAERLQGVKVVTVMVTQETTRSARKEEHSQYLRQTLGYNQGVVDQLVGGSGVKPLAELVSQQVIEVPASGQLKETFMKIISENVTCK